MRSWTAALLLILFAAALTAQESAPEDETPETGEPREIVTEVTLDPQQLEEVVFKKILADAGTSPMDYARALEEFLERFPESSKRPQIERSIAQTAMEHGDRRRLLRYGEAVIQREPHNLLLLEHVIRALLDSEDEETAKRALQYAAQFESAIRLLRLQQPADGSQAVAMKERTDASLGKALVYEARALGNLGQWEEAVRAARSSYAANPTAEAAREAGRWLARLDRKNEALRHYAEAFSISDPDNTARLRQTDRNRLGELYTALHGSEDGLGDVILEAYDRTAEVMAQRFRSFKELDPNYQVTDPMKFVLAGLDGEKLEMSSLRGKLVVLDFWATWCQPCRVQQPLYEEVKAKYEDRDDIVFLNISTDQDRSAVAPFLEREQWDKTIWFEDGLQELFQVSNIPTTILIDQHGEVAGRMNGFHPERFVEMLTARIDRLLASP